MSAKRFEAPSKVALLALRAAIGVVTSLLAICLLTSGCATTSSQSAQYKPHRPQMITANGPEEVGACTVLQKFNRGFDLPDEPAINWPAAILGLPLQALCSGGHSWKP